MTATPLLMSDNPPFARANLLIIKFRCTINSRINQHKIAKKERDLSESLLLYFLF